MTRSNTIEPCTGSLAPELVERLPLIEGIRRHGPQPLTPAQQERLDAFDRPFGPDELAPCVIDHMEAPGPHGPVRLRAYLPASRPDGPRPALVWMHGGAFLGGDLDLPEADQTARYIVGATDCPVVSVDYRLANDGVHHPIPEDDVVAAYRWVRDGGAGLAVDPERIAIGGGSAGACLAASAAMRLRDEGRPVWRTFLFYPPLHAELPPPSDELAHALAKLPDTMQLTPQVWRRIAENYLGGAVAEAPPYAFPGDGHDLSGLGPTYIENCEFDTLRASGERFARQLERAGVPVESATAAGVPHAHLNWVGSRRAYASLQRMADRMQS